MILITGATGFLGSYLMMKLLNNDRNVVLRALFRSPQNIDKTKQFFEWHGKSDAFKRIEWIQADITDIPALTLAFESVNFVYHCAALVSFDPFDESKLRKTNIEGTANVVNLCLDFNVKKIMHVSSIAALGDLLPHEKIITETTEWNPEMSHSDYAISKFGGETEVWRAQQEGLDVLVINPGVILGAVYHSDDWNCGSASIFKTLEKPNTFYTSGSTGFIGIYDVVSIMVQLMQSDIKNEKFILVGENLTYQTFINLISNSIGRKPATFHAKKWMTQIAWRLDWLSANVFSRKRVMSKSLALSLHSTDVYDHSKIKKTLNYDFQPINKVITEVGKVYQMQQLIKQ